MKVATPVPWVERLSWPWEPVQRERPGDLRSHRRSLPLPPLFHILGALKPIYRLLWLERLGGGIDFFEFDPMLRLIRGFSYGYE
jgi:hypothetical protein